MGGGTKVFKASAFWDISILAAIVLLLLLYSFFRCSVFFLLSFRPISSDLALHTSNLHSTWLQFSPDRSKSSANSMVHGGSSSNDDLHDYNKQK